MPYDLNVVRIYTSSTVVLRSLDNFITQERIPTYFILLTYIQIRRDLKKNLDQYQRHNTTKSFLSGLIYFRYLNYLHIHLVISHSNTN